MKTTALDTQNPKVRIVQPDIERDARLGVHWLQGSQGRATLRMMGVPDADNKPSTLEEEKKRVQAFISRDDQLNWMIEYNKQIVGAIWVDLNPTEHLPAPAVHIMIGDTAARGKGIGTAAFRAVIEYLKKTGETRIFSRHLIENGTSSRLLNRLGFTNLGKVYEDEDGLTWQNVSLSIV